MKTNLSKEGVRTAKEIIDKYFPSGLHEDPEQSELNKIFIFNAMEEYASQFKSQSEAVGWISVKERLPEDQQSVLCYNGFNAVMAKYRQVTNEASPRFGDVGDFEVEKYPDKYDRVSSSYWSNITHWQPLPSPPEVSVGEEKKD